jgi:hypothetical protein
MHLKSNFLVELGQTRRRAQVYQQGLKLATELAVVVVRCGHPLCTMQCLLDDNPCNHGTFAHHGVLLPAMGTGLLQTLGLPVSYRQAFQVLKLISL